MEIRSFDKMKRVACALVGIESHEISQYVDELGFVAYPVNKNVFHIYYYSRRDLLLLENKRYPCIDRILFADPVDGYLHELQKSGVEGMKQNQDRGEED